MKTAGMVMIILFSSSLGLMAAKKKKEQLEYVNLLIYMGERILILLKSTMPETDVIMKILQNDKRLDGFDFSLSDAQQYLSCDEKEKLCDMLNNLGRYDIDSQIYMAEEFVQYFRLISQEYRDYYNQHYKMYLVFGIFSGLLVTILLI